MQTAAAVADFRTYPKLCDLAGPRSAPFTEATLERLAAIRATQVDLPRPALLGRVIGLPAPNSPKTTCS